MDKFEFWSTWKYVHLPLRVYFHLQEFLLYSADSQAVMQLCSRLWNFLRRPSSRSRVFRASWKAKSSPGIQEFPCVLWDPKIYYRTHNSPPPVTILSHINPIHVPPQSCFFRIHFNTVIPSTYFEAVNVNIYNLYTRRRWKYKSITLYNNISHIYTIYTICFLMLGY